MLSRLLRQKRYIGKLRYIIVYFVYIRIRRIIANPALIIYKIVKIYVKEEKD